MDGRGISIAGMSGHKSPMSASVKNTIQDAENAIQNRFVKDGFRAVIQYDALKVIENERWWYIPLVWIGCGGFIVSKDELYVNWLGSTSHPNLEECFWGHDHGLYCDMVDFTFAPDTDIKLAARILSKFKHTHPKEGGPPPAEPVWYHDSEIAPALSGQFPTFRRHFVWHAISDLRQAHENEGLQFSCQLSKII